MVELSFCFLYIFFSFFFFLYYFIRKFEQPIPPPQHRPPADVERGRLNVGGAVLEIVLWVGMRLLEFSKRKKENKPLAPSTSPSSRDHTKQTNVSEVPQPSYEQETNPISIVDPHFGSPPPSPVDVAVPQPSYNQFGTQFCSPYPVDLAITRKVLNITNGNFVVTQRNGNVMFQVKDKLLSFRDRRVIIDATGKTIFTLRRQILTVHHRWNVYRGDSPDLIFGVKTSSIIQLKTNLDVFLANNTTEEYCDFKVQGSWLKRSCVVYAGDSSTIIAQMHKKVSFRSVLIGKDKFMVTVYPNVDYAFIVALIVILHEINDD